MMRGEQVANILEYSKTNWLGSTIGSTQPAQTTGNEKNSKWSGAVGDGAKRAVERRFQTRNHEAFLFLKGNVISARVEGRGRREKDLLR
jgi:hypothetical protein